VFSFPGLLVGLTLTLLACALISWNSPRTVPRSAPEPVAPPPRGGRHQAPPPADPPAPAAPPEPTRKCWVCAGSGKKGDHRPCHYCEGSGRLPQVTVGYVSHPSKPPTKPQPAPAALAALPPPYPSAMEWSEPERYEGPRFGGYSGAFTCPSCGSMGRGIDMVHRSGCPNPVYF